jgi:hypothetical protein
MVVSKSLLTKSATTMTRRDVTPSIAVAKEVLLSDRQGLKELFRGGMTVAGSESLVERLWFAERKK